MSTTGWILLIVIELSVLWITYLLDIVSNQICKIDEKLTKYGLK